MSLGALGFRAQGFKFSVPLLLAQGLLRYCEALPKQVGYDMFGGRSG